MTPSTPSAAALPPGPWRFIQHPLDGLGGVRDAENLLVAGHVLPAVADLLIRAEREADPTPVDLAWADTLSIRQKGRDDDDDLWVLGGGDTARTAVLHRRTVGGTFWFISYGGIVLQHTPIRGHVREVCRVLGVTLNEGAGDAKR